MMVPPEGSGRATHPPYLEIGGEAPYDPPGERVMSGLEVAARGR